MDIKPVKYFSFLSLVVLLWTSSVQSQPELTEIEGNIAQDSTVTIKGNGFGDTGKDYRRLWDTVENQEWYDSLSEGTEIPVDSGEWTTNGNAWSNPIRITRTGDLRHDQSEATYTGKKKGYLGWPRSFEDNENRKFYLTWWFKTNDSLGEHGGHNKLTRIWDHPSGDYTRISWTQRLLGAYETSDGSTPGVWKNWDGLIDEWNRLEIYIDSDDEIIKTWTNGNLIHEVSNFKKEDISDGLTIGLVGFDPNQADDYEHIEFRMDDIYASSSPARIELSTSQKWSDTTNNKEIQKFISWKDDNIEFEPYLGDLPEEEQLYIYVVDDNGNVNSEGLPLNNCPECPEPITIQVE